MDAIQDLGVNLARTDQEGRAAGLPEIHEGVHSASVMLLPSLSLLLSLSLWLSMT